MAHSTVVALPGDVIHVGSHETRLGPGIAIDRGEEPFTSKPGILKRKGDQSVWIQSIQKRYVPVEGDRVVGVVIKTGRYHRIDIGSSQSAALPELSFEGTTKRNKINLQVGDCVYGRLSGCGPHFEPQMSCMDSNGRANGMGLLPSNGLILNSTLSLCHQ
jgi:exosome complex component RRP40